MKNPRLRILLTLVLLLGFLLSGRAPTFAAESVVIGGWTIQSENGWMSFQEVPPAWGERLLRPGEVATIVNVAFTRVAVDSLNKRIQVRIPPGAQMVALPESDCALYLLIKQGNNYYAFHVTTLWYGSVLVEWTTRGR